MNETLNQEELQKLQLASLNEAYSGIVITDSKGIILWVNRAFTRLTGYESSEVLGKNLNILKSGKQSPEFYQEMWNTISSGNIWSGELVNTRKDGSLYTEEMTITPILNDEKYITNYIAIKLDITTRKIVEENLHQTLKRLEEQYQAAERARTETRAVLDSTSDAFLLLSPNDQLLWANKTFEQYFALKEEDIVGRSFQELLPHFERVFLDVTKIQGKLSNSHQGQKIKLSETVSQRWPQKRDLDVYTTVVIDENDTALGILLVFRNVTREKQIERLQSEFVSLVSHELRTPLSSVSGYIDMILDRDAGDINEEQKEYLQIAKRNTDKLTKLVSDLLTVSRIESGAITLVWENVNVNNIVTEAADNLKPLFVSKIQALQLELDEKECVVRGDRERLTQVLTNLLSNANKYTPIHGKITVKTRSDRRVVYIDVIDTGIGLNQEDQKKLFTKFFRSRDSEAQNIPGVGLGLWITKALIDMHGGKISVTSEYNKGSTFTITLPLEKKRGKR